MRLSREQFLSGKNRKGIVVEIPNFGEVEIKPISASASLNMKDEFDKVGDDGKVAFLVMVDAIIDSLYDENGEKMFSKDDRDAVMDILTVSDISKLFDVVMSISSPTKKETFEELKKI